LEGLRGVLDFSYSSGETKITDASGNTRTANTTSYYPSLNLIMDTLIYPKLRLNAGGVFETNISQLRDVSGSRRTTLTRLRPYFLLRTTGPTFTPGIGYFRREDRSRSSGSPGLKLVGEDYAGYFGWRPEGLPVSDFQFVRTNTFDEERVFQNSTKDYASLLSRYSYRGLGVYYQGSYLDTNDRIYSLRSRQLTHSGRLDYSTAFIDKRVLWNATYNLTNQEVKTTSSGEGEVALPLVPFAGLVALSDTPATAALSANPLLIDGNLTASSGINLGLPGLGADTQARNIGLDFLNPTALNRLLLWIDRELPSEIAASFSWEIYTSTDNILWTRATTVTAAPFGPFENRFQIDFAEITARYIKVVTAPLSAVVPDATRFPEIYVTEMQAFINRPAGDIERKLTRTSQLLNTDLRIRILDTPSLFYEGSYFLTRTDPGGVKRDILSNGFYLNHRFARIFSLYGRAAREQGTQPEGRRVAYVENATFTVEPLTTLRSTILYSGQIENIDRERNTRHGFFWQNNLQLYQGIDLLIGWGWTFTTRETGEKLRDRLLNISATIVPRQNFSLTFNYVDTTTKRSGLFTGFPNFYTRRGYVTLAVDPVPTLHLVLAEEVIMSSDQKTRTTHNIGANWVPFPDGSLQFLFAYNEALRALEFGKEKTIRPGVRWNLSRRSYLDVTYQIITSEIVFQKTESNILSSSLKLFF